VTFQDQANEFALRVLDGASDIVAKNIAKGNVFTMFGIAGSPQQVQEVLDFVCEKVTGRRVSDVSLILPKILVTRITSGYDLLGTTCVGAIIFKGYENFSVPNVCKVATNVAVLWGLGEVLIENVEQE
jgi:hypothetical protein